MYPKFRFQFAKYTISEAFVDVSLNKIQILIEMKYRSNIAMNQLTNLSSQGV